MIEYVFWVMVMILTTSIFIYSTFLFGTLIGWWVFGYRELFDGLTFYLFYKPEKFVDDDIGDVFYEDTLDCGCCACCGCSCYYDLEHESEGEKE